VAKDGKVGKGNNPVQTHAIIAPKGGQARGKRRGINATRGENNNDRRIRYDGRMNESGYLHRSPNQLHHSKSRERFSLKNRDRQKGNGKKVADACEPASY
jgi:hypothetical protein